MSKSRLLQLSLKLLTPWLLYSGLMRLRCVHAQGHVHRSGFCGGPVMRTWRFGALPGGVTPLVFSYGNSTKRAVLVVRVHPHYDVALN